MRQLCFLVLYIIYKVGKASVWILRYIFVGFVDDVGGNKKYFHSKLTGYHILAHVVAYHNTFLGGNSEGFCYVLVVFEIGL